MAKTTFIAWIGYHRRSDLLAQHLGATMHFIHYGQSRRLIQTPIRYVVQALQTWRVLREDRPDVIFVQNPPIFCVLVAFLYAKRYGARYVIDSHTGAFLSTKWRWSVGLHRLLSKGALATIVHNTSQEKIVKEWGCHYLVLKDPIGNCPAAERFPFDGQFNAVVVSSFARDEPLDIVFEAVTEFPAATFYVTGNYRRAAPALLRKKPDNCRLTGYVSYQRYTGLLQGADVVIDLVSNGHTLLCGAFEAVSVGTPLIVSDWPVLRDCFPLGTVYIPNTVEGVREGVRQAQSEQARLRQEILLLQQRMRVEWEWKFAELQQLLH